MSGVMKYAEAVTYSSPESGQASSASLAATLGNGHLGSRFLGASCGDVAAQRSEEFFFGSHTQGGAYARFTRDGLPWAGLCNAFGIACSFSRFCAYRSLYLLMLALTCAVLFPSVSLAAPKNPSIDRVELGFDGNYKLGYWTPLSVKVSGLPDAEHLSLEVIVPDSDGVPTRVRHPFSFSSRLSSVPPCDYTREPAKRLFVKIGRNSGEMIVVLRDGEREVARRVFDLAGGELTPAMPSDAWLLLSLGTTKHLAGTLAANRQFKSAGGRIVTVTDPARLPDQWYGYEGVDVVVLPGSAEELSELLKADAPMAALDGWLRRGGTLLMTLGGSGEKVLATAGNAANWAPGRFEKIIPMTNAGALERASGVESLLEPLTEGERFSLSAARLTKPVGEVKLAAGLRAEDLPLIIDRCYGFGRVLFVAIDLDEPIMGRWAGTAPLVMGQFLPQQAARDAETPTTQGEVTHAGYDDLSGQLRTTLDQFQHQGVRLLPFGALLGMMMAYVVLLGPGDFLLVKRFLRRMELTWITMPLLILLTCGGAYALAVGLKGNQIHMNQVDVIDYDDVQSARRATTWFTIFSPRGQAYDLTLVGVQPSACSYPAIPARRETPTGGGVLLSWFGLPGTALGGMESRATPPLAGQPYDISSHLDALDEVPIPVWSTKSFVARWTPQGSAPLSANLTPAKGGLEGLLSGTVVNNSNAPLEQCVLLTKRWAYPLGTLAPKERLAIHDGLGPRAAQSYLARRREADEAYDHLGTDSARILQVMSFYRTVGGQDYTRLKHRYDATIDISRQLSDDQAILIGLRPTAAAEVRDGDRPLATASPGGLTMYRVIVPVQSEVLVPRP